MVICYGYLYTNLPWETSKTDKWNNQERRSRDKMSWRWTEENCIYNIQCSNLTDWLFVYEHSLLKNLSYEWLQTEALTWALILLK